MLEARLQSTVMKKVVNAIKDLLYEATFDCSDAGIQIQAMDNSHACLISLTLRSDGFDKFCCDRNLSMGINLTSMAKILNCANNDDTVTMKVHDTAHSVNFMFECQQTGKLSEYEMKLMNLDREHLEIPETNYACIVRMSSMEFARICRDLSQFGESMVISCNKEGMKFSVTGDVGTANVNFNTTSVNEKDKTVKVQMQEPVTLTFACRYLNLFTKATPLSLQVKLLMSADIGLTPSNVLPYLDQNLDFSVLVAKITILTKKSASQQKINKI